MHIRSHTRAHSGDGSSVYCRPQSQTLLYVALSLAAPVVLTHSYKAGDLVDSFAWPRNKCIAASVRAAEYLQVKRK